MKFDELGLAPEIMNAINDAGYTTPTPIQAEAIPHVIAGRDVLGIAQTGTGKTASFTLPMIHRLMKGRAKARMPRTLILEPTRELAAQVADNFDIYGKNTKLTKALLIGGVSFADQEKAIMRGADVLIATPGRLLDHVERGGVLLRGVEVLVIDEADRMLDMGFIPDIERIVKLLPFTRQTLFFSATMPPEITRLTQQFLSAPARVEVAPPSSTNENVSQQLISVSKSQKLKTLKKLFDEEDITNGIIFCNRKRDIGDLLNALQKNGYPVVSLHGDMDQHMRLKMLDRFKGGEATYLIASDVAARGLDIPAVSHVFNYDVPTHAEDYVHRIGRTGRAGRKGAAITLFTKEDGKYIDAIEKLINRKIDVTKTNITPEDIPSDKEQKAASKPRRKNDDKGDKKGREKGERKGLAAFSKNKKEKKHASNAPRSTNKPVQEETRANNAPVGFGENIPAFLKDTPE
ncbi:MAG: DEAD/DEAH box helicase [Candidatus Micropelagos thuwalensis]